MPRGGRLELFAAVEGDDAARSACATGHRHPAGRSRRHLPSIPRLVRPRHRPRAGHRPPHRHRLQWAHRRRSPRSAVARRSSPGSRRRAPLVSGRRPRRQETDHHHGRRSSHASPASWSSTTSARCARCCRSSSAAKATTSRPPKTSARRSIRFAAARCPTCSSATCEMPDGSGVDVLRALKERSPGSVGLLLTAFASADTAVEAMRLGAVDYLTKTLDHRRRPEAARGALSGGQAAQRGAGDPGRGPQEPRLRPGRPQPADPRRHQPGGPGRPHRRQRAHHRRVGHRQGMDGPRDPPAVDPPGAAVRRRQLRRLHRVDPRIGAVRPHEGVVHRRRRHQEGAARVGRSRHAVPRRGGGDQPRHAGEAAARAAGTPLPPRRRHAGTRGRRPLHRRHQPQPRGDGAHRRASARTSSSASTSSRCGCRRCASAPRTSRFSPTSSCAASPTGWGGRCAASAHETMRLLHGLPLARQRPRARERDGARRGPRTVGRTDAPTACRRTSREAPAVERAPRRSRPFRRPGSTSRRTCSRSSGCTWSGP